MPAIIPRPSKGTNPATHAFHDMICSRRQDRLGRVSGSSPSLSPVPLRDALSAQNCADLLLALGCSPGSRAFLRGILECLEGLFGTSSHDRAVNAVAPSRTSFCAGS